MPLISKIMNDRLTKHVSITFEQCFFKPISFESFLKEFQQLTNLFLEDFELFWVNLAFVGLMPLLYTLFVHQSKELHGFSRWQIFVFDAAYVAYLLVMVFFVLKLFDR